MPSRTATRSAGLTLAEGTALYVGAVLGTGAIAMPALAASVAGPASLLSWLALVLLSVPLAATFAALGARYPDAGGVSTYVRRAFGAPAATLVGWCFYLTVPPAMAAAAMFAGAYVDGAVGGGNATVFGTAAAAILAVTVANTLGLRVSGRVALVFAALLALLLLVAAVASLPHARLANLHPFAPYGWGAVASAAAVLVWSFSGWEAVTHLAAEFRNPARNLPRAAGIAVVTIGVLYLAVATASVLVLGSAAERSAAPLADLLAIGLGGSTRLVAAVAAVLLTLGTMNAYQASAAKLGAALGRDGALPLWLAHGSEAGETPRRSLALVTALAAASLAAAALLGTGPRPLVMITTGSFVTVYALGSAAALRLLRTARAARWSAAIALLASLALLVAAGRYLAWPGLLAVVCLLYLRLRTRHERANPPPPAHSGPRRPTPVPTEPASDGGTTPFRA